MATVANSCRVATLCDLDRCERETVHFQKTATIAQGASVPPHVFLKKFWISTLSPAHILNNKISLYEIDLYHWVAWWVRVCLRQAVVSRPGLWMDEHCCYILPYKDDIHPSKGRVCLRQPVVSRPWVWDCPTMFPRLQETVRWWWQDAGCSLLLPQRSEFHWVAWWVRVCLRRPVVSRPWVWDCPAMFPRLQETVRWWWQDAGCSLLLPQRSEFDFAILTNEKYFSTLLHTVRAEICVIVARKIIHMIKQCFAFESWADS